MAVSISDLVRDDRLQRLSPRDRELVALTIAGEIDPRQTRYGSPEAEREIASILQSIETRAARSGKTPGQVVKERKQYSTWNSEKGRRTAKENYERHSSEILRAMSGYYSGRTAPAGPNIINYYSPSGMKPRGATPNWDFSQLRFEGQVGPHRFYSPFEEFGSRNMPRPRPEQTPGLRGTAVAGLPPPASSARAESPYPANLPATLAWDTRFYSPTMAEAWGSPSATAAVPERNVAMARAATPFAVPGAIDPSRASATGGFARTPSAAAQGAAPRIPAALRGSAVAGLPANVAAEALKPILTPSAPIPVQTQPITVPSSRGIVGGFLNGGPAEAARAAPQMAEVGRLARAAPTAAAVEAGWRPMSPQSPVQSPAVFQGNLPRPRPEIAPAGISAASVPEIPTVQPPQQPSRANTAATGTGAGLLGGLITPEMQQMAMEAAQKAKAAAIKAFLFSGPIEGAQIRSMGGGPREFWGALQNLAGSNYGPNVARASYLAAQNYGGGQQQAPRAAPAPRATGGSVVAPQGSAPSWASNLNTFSTGGGNNYVELPNGTIVKV